MSAILLYTFRILPPLVFTVNHYEQQQKQQILLNLYTSEDGLLHDNSMDSYNHFLVGWVTEILVKDDVRLVITK